MFSSSKISSFVYQVIARSCWRLSDAVSSGPWLPFDPLIHLQLAKSNWIGLAKSDFFMTLVIASIFCLFLICCFVGFLFNQNVESFPKCGISILMSGYEMAGLKPGKMRSSRVTRVIVLRRRSSEPG